jgi:single-strand DNA-binding protein
MSFNKIFVVGNLGRDPELRTLPSGASVCNFNVAVNESNSELTTRGDRTAIWFRIAVFGRGAERCAKELKRGSKVYVAGRLRPREWEDKQGYKHQQLEIMAADVKLFGKPTSETVRMP